MAGTPPGHPRVPALRSFVNLFIVLYCTVLDGCVARSVSSRWDTSGSQHAVV